MSAVLPLLRTADPRPELWHGELWHGELRHGELRHGDVLQIAEQRARVEPTWSRAELSGRLVELSGQGASAALTLAFGVVVDAQHRGEPVAWVSAVADRGFFAPDAADGGVDLGSLALIHTPDPIAAGRAADKLLRSGAFGLVVLDLGGDPALPVSLQARLVKLGQKHDAAVLCLTDKPPRHPSLSSLVSLRCVAERVRVEPSGYECRLRVLKDKRHGPGWSFVEPCRGPPGLR